MKTLFATLFLLVGCAAAPTKPYVTLIVPPHDELAWFSDGPQALCEVHAPRGRAVSGELVCVAQDETFATRLPMSLAAGESKIAGFCQVMNRDVHAEPCSFVEAGQ